MTFKEKLQRRARKNTSVKALVKFGPYDIILAPVLTEKTYKQQEVANKYVFKVHNDANKNDIDAAIQYIYKVTPVKINVVNTAFKGRERRKLVKRAFKKAIVTLAKDQKIEFAV
ncbi:MAG: 50S ribosomal protein L23 [bacterium]|nr:50S ribosomal protein L23 [bacterium]